MLPATVVHCAHMQMSRFIKKGQEKNLLIKYDELGVLYAKRKSNY